MAENNIDEIEINSEETVEDVDGEIVSREAALAEFKMFVMQMNVAAYEEAVLRFGLPKSEAKALCIPTKLGKEYSFKCYQPQAAEVVTEEEASEFDGDKIDE